MRGFDGFLVVMIGVLLAASAGMGQQSASNPATRARPAATRAAVAPPAFKAVANMRQLMEAMVVPNSTALFNAASDPPTSDQGWAAVQNAAVALAESGNLLMIGERARDEAAWMKMSRALVDAGARALRAAEAKNADALPVAGDEVVSTCETCHDRYMSESSKP